MAVVGGMVCETLPTLTVQTQGIKNRKQMSKLSPTLQRGSRSIQDLHCTVHGQGLLLFNCFSFHSHQKVQGALIINK